MAIATTKRGAGERGRSRENATQFSNVLFVRLFHLLIHIHIYVFYYIILYYIAGDTTTHSKFFFTFTFRVASYLVSFFFIFFAI